MPQPEALLLGLVPGDLLGRSCLLARASDQFSKKIKIKIKTHQEKFCRICASTHAESRVRTPADCQRRRAAAAAAAADDAARTGAACDPPGYYSEELL